MGYCSLLRSLILKDYLNFFIRFKQTIILAIIFLGLQFPLISEEKTDFVNNVDNITNLEYDIKELLYRVENLEYKIYNIKNYINDLEKKFDITKSKDNILVNLVEGNNELEEKDYNIALSNLRNGNYSLSTEKFESFIKNYPSSNLISNAYFWIGESYLRQNLLDKSYEYFSVCYSKAPRGGKAPDSLLKLAIILGKLGKKDEVCSMITKLRNQFPNRISHFLQIEEKLIFQYNCFKS